MQQNWDSKAQQCFFASFPTFPTFPVLLNLNRIWIESESNLNYAAYFESRFKFASLYPLFPLFLCFWIWIESQFCCIFESRFIFASLPTFPTFPELSNLNWISILLHTLNLDSNLPLFPLFPLFLCFWIWIESQLCCILRI